MTDSSSGDVQPEKPPPRYVARIEEHLGRVLLGLVSVRDRDWLQRRRRSIVLHGVVFAIGILMMQALGVGWIIVPLLTAVHLVAFTPRRVLTATAAGLEIVELKSLSVESVAQMPLGCSATMTLKHNDPQVAVQIASNPNPDETSPSKTGEMVLWEGSVLGSDLKIAEQIVRAGGGEPVRVKR